VYWSWHKWQRRNARVWACLYAWPCCPAALLHCCAAVLLRRCTAAALHCCTAAALYCCTAVLLRHCTAGSCLQAAYLARFWYALTSRCRAGRYGAQVLGWVDRRRTLSLSSAGAHSHAAAGQCRGQQCRASAVQVMNEAEAAAGAPGRPPWPAAAGTCQGAAPQPSPCRPGKTADGQASG
jgi:hypothetical protein